MTTCPSKSTSCLNNSWSIDSFMANVSKNTLEIQKFCMPKRLDAGRQKLLGQDPSRNHEAALPLPVANPASSSNAPKPCLQLQESPPANPPQICSELALRNFIVLQGISFFQRKLFPIFPKKLYILRRCRPCHLGRTLSPNLRLDSAATGGS